MNGWKKCDIASEDSPLSAEKPWVSLEFQMKHVEKKYYAEKQILHFMLWIPLWNSPPDEIVKLRKKKNEEQRN